VDVSADDDVLSLRSKLSEEFGLPASHGLRLKCSRDLRDGDPISAIGARVHAMLGGGLAGGGGRRETMPDSSDDESVYGSYAKVSPSTSSASKRARLAPVQSSGEESNSGASGSEAVAVEAEAKSEAEEDEGEGEGEGTSDEDEAAEGESGEEDALLIGGFSPRPFQKSIIDIVEKAADPRAIQWVYSLLGKYGKSLLAEYLVERYDALVIHEDAAKDSLKRIRDHRKASDTFAQKPVLIIDIPRSKSTHTKTLYTTLETIQGVHGEWTTPPHILVFANTSPDMDKLSPDRMHVYLITSEYVLQPAKHLEKGLEKYDEQLAALQAQEEEAARTGVTPARLLPERGAAGSSGVTSSAPPDDVHQAREPPLLEPAPPSAHPN